jgi:hypothetical protein
VMQVACRTGLDRTAPSPALRMPAPECRRAARRSAAGTRG